MKDSLRQLFRPILARFEDQAGAFEYKPSHRKILKVVGSLFFVLSIISLAAGIVASRVEALFPALIFFGIGLVCMVVGFLGTDQAVARMWKSR